MASNSEQTLSSGRIIAEIEAVVAWHSRFLRHCLYPASGKLPDGGFLPDSLLGLCRQQAEKGVLDKSVVEHIAQAHARLQGSAKHLQESPSLEKYDAMSLCVAGYVAGLCRLQQEMGGVEIDLVTGLRTGAMIHADLKMEQARFERKGALFSVAVMEIDRMRELQEKYDASAVSFFCAHVAQTVIRVLRPFDDAYYFGNGEYAIVLKQVDFLDACTAIDRLHFEVEAHPAELENGERVKLTASFGVAEVVKLDAGDIILGHARESLKSAKAEGGNRVHEYREKSKLAKFALKDKE